MPRPLIPERRSKILNVAEELALEQGFDQISVQLIAQKTGIGKGAVYLEFTSKADIVQALLSRGFSRLTQQVQQRIQRSPQEFPSLSQVYRFSLEALLQDRLMLAAFLDDRAVLGRVAQQAPAQRYQQRVAWLEEYLLVLQQAGLLDAQLQVAAVALALSSFTIGLLSAPTLLGPLNQQQFSAAIEVVVLLIERGLEQLPAYPAQVATQNSGAKAQEDRQVANHQATVAELFTKLQLQYQQELTEDTDESL